MTAPRARVLIVEDTPTQAELALTLLRDVDADLRVATTAGQALAAMREWRPDAMLLDLQLPDYSGFELMRQMKAESLESAVVVVTANGSVNTAVEAMREGAVDFLIKPFARARLVTTLGNVLERRALAAELRSVRAQIGRDSFFGFIGASPVMQAVYRTIESVAASKASVFVVGESGTGKELAAEAVHKSSPRRSKAFVPINCGAIPRDLLESEIFGHVKGAFTGATSDRTGAARTAHEGTFFLDEIGEMPLEMQVKLLRFVQTGVVQPVGAPRGERVDVRFVCATNRDPLAEVEAGRFREDLFYRLYVVPLELPPLRARGEDVVLIARHFLRQFGKEEGKRFKTLAPDAEAALMAYTWPGNVRQLQNVMRNTVVLHDGEAVTAAMLPALVLRGARRLVPAAAMEPAPPPLPVPIPAEPAEAEPQPMAADEPAPFLEAEAIAPPTPPTQPATIQTPIMHLMPAPPPPPAEPEIMPLAAMERRLIEAALVKTGHDVPRAAALLEVNPSTIYRKLQAWRGGKTTA